MEDAGIPLGVPNSSKVTAGKANVRLVPAYGVVKDNVDLTRSGRIRVYISDISGEKADDADSWTTLNFMSPFYGRTEPTAPSLPSSTKENYGSFKGNPSSYGMWFSPPDIGTTVMCIFPDGDMTYGYWIGCLPDPEALHMVPAIGAVENIVAVEGEAASYGGALKLPVTNLNFNNKALKDSSGFLQAPKPVHSYVASILFQQGLIRDSIRGVIGSSSQRESPSRLGWGVSTPGRPIYEGGFTDETIAKAATNANQQSGLKVVARRGGHSLVMDDGNLIGQDQLVRLRTALGHQILMSDDGQCLFIIHSNGQSWIELGKEGTIDMYSTNSVNIRTQGDLNLHADNNININAKKSLNIQADEININSEKDINLLTGNDFKAYTMGKHTHKIDGEMSMSSIGEASFASSAITYINGSNINLNTGQSKTVPLKVTAITQILHTDTLGDNIKGYIAAPGKLLSIVSRAPAHQPWVNAGLGVDVKVTNNAAAVLPVVPAEAVAAINQKANTAAPPVPTVAVASTVPPVTQVSAAVNKNTTAAMISSAATTAATGLKAAAVKLGTNLVDGVASIGALGLTPTALTAAGNFKPGADALINGLTQGGANAAMAMTTNLMTGKPGAETLTQLTNNISAQVSAQISNFQQSQTSLTSAGLLTGKEAPGAIAGVIMSGATVGNKETIDAIKTAAASASGELESIAAKLGGPGNEVTNAIKSGNFSAQLAGTVTGGTGSITAAVGSMGIGLSSLAIASKGAAAEAFEAIAKSLKGFTPGIPQNLLDIAKKSAELAQKIGKPSGKPGETAMAQAAAGSTPVSATAILADASKLIGPLATSTGINATVASGIAALPGGLNSISTVLDNAKGATNTIPGTQGLTNLINTATTASTNGISLSASTLAEQAKSLTGVASSMGVDSITGRIPAIDAAFASGGVSGGLTALTGQLSQAGFPTNPAAIPGLPAIPGMPVTPVIPAIPKLPSYLGFDTSKIGLDKLASLTLTGLPADASQKLNSAISALSAGGTIPIKLPTIAINTFDRTEITSRFSSLLGDKTIPIPNFSMNMTITNQSSEQIKEYDKVKAEIANLDDMFLADRFTTLNAEYALSNAKNNLPQGDPKIASLQSVATEARAKLVALEQKITALRNQQYKSTTEALSATPKPA